MPLACGVAHNSHLVVAEYFAKQRLDKDDSLCDIFDDFVGNFKGAFATDRARDDGRGLPLHWTSLHGRYLKEFTRTCAWVLSVNKASEQLFFRECRETLAGNPPSSFDAEKHAWFVEAMMAALDFNCFVKHMRTKAKGLAKKGGESKMSSYAARGMGK